MRSVWHQVRGESVCAPNSALRGILAAEPQGGECLKKKLIRLGHPWPEYLETKTVDWLETEIRTIKRTAQRTN